MSRARQWWRGLALATLLSPLAALAADKPNILVIFGDDIGYFNLSAYNQGMMGYETPNIDRIAREGALFTHAYGEQSCTYQTLQLKRALMQLQKVPANPAAN